MENKPQDVEDTRQSWIDYYMVIATTVATRSSCLRRKVGAVAVNKNNRVIGTGYNGPPAKMKHCNSETCIRTAKNIPSGTALEVCKALHAEQNLILQLGDQLQDATIYVTHRPCTTCIKLLIGAKVSRVIWKEDYPDEYSEALMFECGKIISLTEDDGVTIKNHMFENSSRCGGRTFDCLSSIFPII